MGGEVAIPSLSFCHNLPGLTMIKITGNPEAKLRALQKKFPKQTNKALARVSAEVKAIAKKAIANPMTWPTFNPELKHETIVARRTKGNPSSDIGGRLGKQVRSYYKNGYWYIGWPEYLRGYGDSLQTKQRRKKTKGELAYFHARKVKQPDTNYDRKARPIWRAFEKNRQFQKGVKAIILKRMKEIKK